MCAIHLFFQLKLVSDVCLRFAQLLRNVVRDVRVVSIDYKRFIIFTNLVGYDGD